MPIDGEKKCSKCGVTKPLDCFTRTKQMRDGRYPSCKSCKSADSLARRLNDPVTHAAKQAEADRRYRERHPDVIYERKRKWGEANKDRIRSVARAWVEKNREKVRLYVRMSNARRRSEGGRNSHKVVDDLLRRQKGKCIACRILLKGRFHIDHILPLKLGGDNARTNLQLLCPTCNLRKKDKHPVDFMQSRGFLI